MAITKERQIQEDNIELGSFIEITSPEIETPIEQDYNYIITDDSSAEHSGSNFGTMAAAGFSYSGVNVSGYVTRPNGGIPIENATVILGTANYTPSTIPPNYCAINPSNQTTTTTDSTGYFILGNNLQITSGNSTCDLNIIIIKDGFVTNLTNVTITGLTQIYTDTNRTLQMHANIIAAITTDLPHAPYSYFGENYNATVKVTNLGDVAADNVTVNLTAIYSTILTTTPIIIGTINGTDYGTANFTVRSPYSTLSDTLTTNVTAFDSDNSNAINASNYTIIQVVAPVLEVTITSPAEGSVMGPSALLLSNTSYNSTVCYFSNDSADISTNMTQINATHYNATTPVLADGNHTYFVKCEDEWNQTAYANVTWYADAIGPAIEFTESTIIRSGTILNFTLIDAMSNLSSGYWNATNSTGWVSNGSTAYTGVDTGYLEINTTGWVGNATINVWANDTWNNINNNITRPGFNDSTEINITIDDIIPVVIINAPNTSEWFGNRIFVNVTATDENLDKVYARWINTTNESVTGNWTELLGAGADYFIGDITDLIGVGQENVTIVVNATDLAGNYNDTENVTVQIDRTPPVVLILSPVQDSNVSRTAIYIDANVTDYESGVDFCNVYLDGFFTDTIDYDKTTGKCTGTISATNTVGNDDTTLNITAVDFAGNMGYNDTVSFFLYYESGGGGSGGGGAGGKPGTNETPKNLDLEFTIEPPKGEVVSNETISFIIKINNTGEDVLNNIVIKTYDIKDGEYYTDPTGINLIPGEEGTLELLISPVSLDTGIYRINLRIGNDKYSEGGIITLDVTNVADYIAKIEASQACNSAEEYINTIKEQGTNTSDVEDSLAYARTKISEGDYATAGNICASILALTPNEIANGGNPLTGFFIETVGPFVMGNLGWLLIAASIMLASYLGRRQIADLFVGFKKKGKGGAANGKPAAKPAVKEAPKPEAPKAVAPKPEEKKPEAPKKDDQAWKIEWR
ncbi:MAG: hypothetical protein PHH61_05195 [Candidatus Nanoarchaeia archaeon]|nr:hypothetical protein [Candidatus Nanoarchaeia archaeon]